MAAKSEWLKKKDVYAAVEAMIAEGRTAETITGSQLAERLGTGSRSTVYRFFDEWKSERAITATTPRFVLTGPERERAIDLLEALMGGALEGEREGMHQELAGLREGRRGDATRHAALLDDMERTEAERDELAGRVAGLEGELARLGDELRQAQAMTVVLERDRVKLLRGRGEPARAALSASPCGDLFNPPDGAARDGADQQIGE